MFSCFQANWLPTNQKKTQKLLVLRAHQLQLDCQQAKKNHKGCPQPLWKQNQFQQIQMANKFDGENLMAKIWWRKFDGENLMAKIWWRKFDGENLMAKIWWRKSQKKSHTTKNMGWNNPQMPVLQTILGTKKKSKKNHLPQIVVQTPKFDASDIVSFESTSIAVGLPTNQKKPQKKNVWGETTLYSFASTSLAKQYRVLSNLYGGHQGWTHQLFWWHTSQELKCDDTTNNCGNNNVHSKILFGTYGPQNTSCCITSKQFETKSVNWTANIALLRR